MEKLMLFLLSFLPALSSPQHSALHYSDVFASVSGVEELLQPEMQVVETLSQLRRNLTDSLRLLDRYIDSWDAPNLAAISEEKERQLNGNHGQEISPRSLSEQVAVDERYAFNSSVDSASDINVSRIHHPIDMYLMIKRLTVEWDNLSQSLKNIHNNSQMMLNVIEDIKSPFKYPEEADLSGAAMSLVKIQNLFNLDLKSLGQGLIPGSYTHVGKDLKSFGHLRPWDFILLGNEAYEAGLSGRAVEWFRLAVETSSEFQLTEEEKRIIETLKSSILKLDTPEVKKLLQTADYEYQDVKLRTVLTNLEESENERRLCAGETLQVLEEHLHCLFTDAPSPYFILMPLKVEVLHDVPRIVVIHNFISTQQTTMIKNGAKKHLQTSTYNSNNGSITGMMRLSKTAWIAESDDHADRMKKISKKIEALTRMNVLEKDASELYQVVNYGMGGYYKFHSDYGVLKNDHGDRLTTCLIYLSNLEGGGATAFTRLGIKVQPEEGMLLLWYNLFRSGKSDNLTFHSSCPVLHGSKWITTKWIYYNQQFLKQPCTLNQDERFTFP